MGKQYAEDIVREVLLLGIDQEGLLGKAVPAMAEPRRGLKAIHALLHSIWRMEAFKTAGNLRVYDSGFVILMLPKQNPTGCPCRIGKRQPGLRSEGKMHKCAFVLETGTPKP